MTRRAVLLAIHPRHCSSIVSGSKTVELRRRFPHVAAGAWVYLYTTLPVGAVTCRAQIVEVRKGKPMDLWDASADAAGVGEAEFFEYFDGCLEGVAIELGRVEEFDRPVGLESLRQRSLAVPQSYRFLSRCEEELLTSDV